MKKLVIVLLCFVYTSLIIAAELKPGTYAIFKTSMGDITCMLFADLAPITVANFVGLATGSKDWLDPSTGKKMTTPLYSNLIFHRVIPNFMIQSGDPTGTGRGGPGYRFNDEFHPSLKHDRAGRLSMANSGTNTNGSQFFITHRPTQWLDNKHTIFGQVVDGMKIVDAIGNVPKNKSNKPLTDVVLKEIVIKMVRANAKEKNLKMQNDKPVILK